MSESERPFAARWRALVEEAGPAGAVAARRGRVLERAGRVLALRVSPDGLEGRVQASHAQPLRAVVGVPSFTGAQWAELVGQVAGQVRHRARVLAGLEPRGLEADLADRGVELLPPVGALSWTCACDEDRRPCSHCGAVMEAAAVRLVGEPLWLLRLRGYGQQQLLLDLSRRGGDEGEALAGVRSSPEEWDEPLRTPPVAVGTGPFGGDPLEPVRRAGPVPGWPGGPDPVGLLGRQLQAGAERARAALGEFGEFGELGEVAAAEGSAAGVDDDPGRERAGGAQPPGGGAAAGEHARESRTGP